MGRAAANPRLHYNRTSFEPFWKAGLTTPPGPGITTHGTGISKSYTGAWSRCATCSLCGGQRWICGRVSTNTGSGAEHDNRRRAYPRILRAKFPLLLWARDITAILRGIQQILRLQAVCTPASSEAIDTALASSRPLSRRQLILKASIPSASRPQNVLSKIP